MKLVLKNGDKEMSLDVVESRIEGSVTEFIVNLYRQLFAEPTPVKIDAPKGDSETFAEHYGCLPTEFPTQRDSFTIRERLPNNVVDLTQLNVKQAVTEAALVRCPKCGQSHAIVLMDGDKLYLMRRSYTTNEFGIICSVSTDDGEAMEEIRPTGDTPKDKLEYFFKLQSTKFLDNKDFNVENDTEVFCPVCGQSSPFYEWKDAYENKGHYFEHQYVCGVCGGECVMDASEEKKSSEIVVCTQCERKWLKEQV